MPRHTESIKVYVERQIKKCPKCSSKSCFTAVTYKIEQKHTKYFKIRVTQNQSLMFVQPTRIILATRMQSKTSELLKALLTLYVPMLVILDARGVVSSFHKKKTFFWYIVFSAHDAMHSFCHTMFN